MKRAAAIYVAIKGFLLARSSVLLGEVNQQGASASSDASAIAVC